jgi:hypothetical protein
MQYIKNEVQGVITTIREMNKRQLASQVVNLGAPVLL